MTHAEARDSFRDILCTSLIGPGSDPDSVGKEEEEQLGDFPLKRYYSGVLFPVSVRQTADFGEEHPETEDPGAGTPLPEEELTEPEIEDPTLQGTGDEDPASRYLGRVSGEEVEVPQANQFFPRNMGLTACVSHELTELLVDVDLGLYTLLDPSTKEASELIRVKLSNRNLYDDMMSVPGRPARLEELIGYDDEHRCLYLKEAVRGERKTENTGDYGLLNALRQALKDDGRPTWLPIMPLLQRLLRPCWQRHPYQITKSLQLGADGTYEVELGNLAAHLGLSVSPAPMATLHVKTVTHVRGSERRHYVKVLLANTSQFENERFISSNRELNVCCFYQTKLTLRIPKGSPHRLLSHRAPAEQDFDSEAKLLTYLYQDVHSYGQGHSCAVQWPTTSSPEAPDTIYTSYLPEVRIPGTSTTLSKEVDPDELATRVGELKRLSVWLPENEKPSQTDKILIEELHTFAGLYAAWHDTQKIKAGKVSSDSPPAMILSRQHATVNRLQRNIELLRDKEVMTCFRLANTAMLMQMVLSDDPDFGKDEKAPGAKLHGAARYAGLDLEHPYQSLDAFEHHPGRRDGTDSNGRDNYIPFSYRPFQLAFLLLNLESIVNPAHADRNLVDLIWFPTGGGKTEAYLALTAFTILWRRLKYPGEGGGVAVLMRYTLRLLTAQQFERAARLICALEFLRKHDETYREYGLGEERITIGMWVGGSTTPNRLDDANQKITAINNQFGQNNQPETLQTRLAEARKQNKFALSSCPWCGTRLIEARDNRAVHGFTISDKQFKATCQNRGRCAFAQGASLPIDVVDESLYHSPPTLLFATVDKFAQLAHRAEGRFFFGLRANGKHQLPPDLIIQDELHLLNGPLGSVVGLFESAVELLATRERDGQRVAPKIVASTATTRNTAQQIKALYGGREVSVFPPTGVRYNDSFFARATDQGKRVHIGFLPTGKTGADTQVRLMAGLLLQRSRLLQAVHEQQPNWSALVDSYWTLVGYFNSLKDVGKTRNQMGAEVTEYLRALHERYHLDRDQYSFAYRGLEQRTSELTSREQSHRIKSTLDELTRTFPTEKPWYDRENRTTVGRLDTVDVVLASNMLSVGIDIERFNLMLMVGQPKNVAEYIQASSRVARNHEGLVVSLLNPNRAREVSYFENYTAFNQAYYKGVEPLTVTPYTTVALDKALNLVLVAYIRHRPGGLPANSQADKFKPEMADELREFLKQRIPPGAQQTYALERLNLLCHNGQGSGWYNMALQSLPTNPMTYKDALLLTPTANSIWAMMTSLREVDTNSVVQTNPYGYYLNN